MKKIIGLIALILFSGGIIWWLISRKSVIKKSIQSTVQSKTNHLYKINYDSSYFDEINGNAVLYNVTLKVDSSILQQVILYDTIPSNILNIKIKSIAIEGLKSLKLLTGSSIDVTKITINYPAVTMDKLISNDTTNKNTNDSVELYKALIGNFNYIKTKAIVINHASFKYNNRPQNQLINVADANVLITDFNIDKDHNYKQLLDYFVKNASVNVGKSQLTDTANKQLFSFDSLHYDSFHGELIVTNIRQEKKIISLFAFNGLNTSDFIYKKLFNSKKLNIENVGLNIEEKPSSNNQKDSLSIAVNDILTAVKVDTLSLKNAYVSIKNKDKETLRITGINAMLPNIKFDSISIPLNKFLSKKEIDFSCKEVFAAPARGLHRVQLWNITYAGKAKKLTIDKLHLEPQYDKDVAMQVEGHPTDVFFVDMKNMSLTDCNIIDMFLNNSVAASSVTGSMDFKVYENHTLYDPYAHKPTDYPQKKIGEAKVAINIPLIHLTNSSLIYEEKSHDTKMISQVAFYKADIKIQNVHNRENLSQPMLVDIQSKFLNVGDFTTHWSLPYGGQNFTISGKMGPMNMLAAAPVGRGMGSVDIKKGNLDAFSFNISGNPTQAHGWVSAQYHDIKVDFLKTDDKTGDLEKKDFQSFLANLLIRKKNDNPKPKKYDYTPRLGDSFFGTSWLAIFTGLKKIAM